jgi:hypothetical protein
MQLIHRKIPREFLEMLPEGMKFIHRHGKEFLVVEELLCPNGHSLMVESVRIHDEPSIRISVERPEGSGLIFIDAYWGSHAKLYNFIADPSHPMDYAQAHCPHCGASLVVDRSCGRIDCGSQKSLMFRLPGEGNAIYVCAKLGCPDHSIVVGNVPAQVAKEVDQINFFGYGDDDEAFGGI